MSTSPLSSGTPSLVLCMPPQTPEVPMHISPVVSKIRRLKKKRNFVYLCEFMCAMCIQIPTGHQIPWNWSAGICEPLDVGVRN